MNHRLVKKAVLLLLIVTPLLTMQSCGFFGKKGGKESAKGGKGGKGGKGKADVGIVGGEIVALKRKG